MAGGGYSLQGDMSNIKKRSFSEEMWCDKTNNEDWDLL